MMQLKDLQAFQTIAEMGNLHHAAHALGVTQPALTKTVQRLETALGVRLLERTARGVALTSIGRTLVARSRTLGQMVDDIQTEIHDLKIGQTGDMDLNVDLAPLFADGVREVNLILTSGDFLSGRTIAVQEGSGITFRASDGASAAASVGDAPSP